MASFLLQCQLMCFMRPARCDWPPSRHSCRVLSHYQHYAYRTDTYLDIGDKMIIVHRTALRRRLFDIRFLAQRSRWRSLHQSAPKRQKAEATQNPRLSPTGDVIEDDFARIREDYSTPKHPIVLAHGLFGFDEIHPVGRMLPGVQYWSGIEEALATKGIEVITATVPPSGRIEVRAQRLADDINAKAKGKAVNIIA